MFATLATEPTAPGRTGGTICRSGAPRKSWSGDGPVRTGRPAVPLLDLQAQYRPLRDELLAAIERVCDSQRFILGPRSRRSSASWRGARRRRTRWPCRRAPTRCSSAMMALGIGPGDEVITTTYSFFATAGCVSRLGATPVFVDIDPDTYNLDPDAVRAAITPRRGRSLPVHLYGLCADMDPLLAVAAAAGVP